MRQTKSRRRSRNQLDLDKQEVELRVYEDTHRISIELSLEQVRTQTLNNINQELENRRFRIDLTMRCVAAILIPSIVIYWLYRVLSIVTTQQAMPHNEGLSETSIVALLGTTSITVIGMLAIVVRYLFTQPIARTTLPNSVRSNPINY